MAGFRQKMFRGAKVEDVILHLEQLTRLSQERAERYANDPYWSEHASATLHEGMYQGYKDTLNILKEEFNYPQK